MTFKDLELNEALIAALQTLGFNSPTPIQQQAIPQVLKGKDIFGCAQYVTKEIFVTVGVWVEKRRLFCQYLFGRIRKYLCP